MGYTTDFRGSLSITPEITEQHSEYINNFSSTRRMKRDNLLAATLEDPLRIEVGLTLGEDGEFFTGGSGPYGQNKDLSILDYNSPPSTQPGLWCQWIIEDGELMWDGGEKFYNYIDWLEYMIENFFKPWGYELEGSIEWRGEDWDDTGTIKVKDNKITIK